MVIALLSSRRRFTLIALLLVITAIIFVQSSDYRTSYLPPTPGFSGNRNEVVDDGAVHDPPRPDNPVLEKIPTLQGDQPSKDPILKDYEHGADHVVEDPKKEDVVKVPEQVGQDHVVDDPNKPKVVWASHEAAGEIATTSTATTAVTADNVVWASHEAAGEIATDSADTSATTTTNTQFPATSPTDQADAITELFPGHTTTEQPDAITELFPGHTDHPTTTTTTTDEGDAITELFPGHTEGSKPNATDGSISNDSTGTTVNGPEREPYDAIQAKIQQLIKDWKPPPVKNHWPPYEWYTEDNYDPNRWEAFDWENDYYLHNGIQQLRDRGLKSEPYRPYPDYNSLAWKRQWTGEYVPCKGPRGKLFNESDDDVIKAWTGLPEEFPPVTVGDANVTDIDIERCFDRYQRYGPYGIGKSVGQNAQDWERPAEGVQWDQVRWGELQASCLLANKERYEPDARTRTTLMSPKTLPDHANDMPKPVGHADSGHYHSRTAVLIRAWEGYEYEENDIQAMRALISELSLQSGGEYQVFLFINIKDMGVDIYTDKHMYDELVKANAPPEFHDITILWSEPIFPDWYPKVGDHQVYWQQFMCLQWFSKTHPQFDFVWNWEVDARYTGHHYNFLEGVSKFSRKAPRKFLWERNQRYYVPSAHGSYKDFLADTDAEIKRGMAEGSVKPVWGPLPYDEARQRPIGPTPPSPMSADSFHWGVGEEADLITLLPIWDPVHTEWTMKDKIWNFVPGVRPKFDKSPIAEGFTHPEFVNIPRRAFINTLSRFSAKLLHAMHLENAAGRSMQAELWPATVALQHGLKAVYAPHPIWLDRKWPGWYLDAVINANDNRTARWGAERDSPYNHDREHNFAGWSWYYSSDFPGVLYRRWLGWLASVGAAAQFPNNPLRVLGGDEFEKERKKVQLPPSIEADGSQAAPAGGQSFGGTEIEVGGKGRMCLPPMLLHPVKYVNRDEPQELGK